MSLQEWKKNGWLKDHHSSPQEIKGLFDIVNRDLLDAQTDTLSADWRFGIAYNAALKLCSILLVAEGYRPDKNLAHYRTLQAMPLILGQHKRADAEYLDMCRVKRNTVEYDCTGAATVQNATELIQFAQHLRDEVQTWLQAKHPDLSSKH
jgi:uncharacterized protein (UPF0332 family)